MKNLIKILKMNQQELFNYIVKFVPNAEIKDGKYIYINNGNNCLLNAHLDTVDDHKRRRPTYDISIKDNIISSTGNNVVGGDDRAGVWIMLSLILKGVIDYSYIFTCDEEVGGIGANQFVDDHIHIEHTCVVSLDRRGCDEIALYGVDNKDLISIFEEKGYIRDMGSYTDLVPLCEAYGMAGVNLSVGYNNEHTNNEIQNIDDMTHTYNILNNETVMLKLSMLQYNIDRDEHGYSDEDTYCSPLICECCLKHNKLYECSKGYYCSSCLSLCYC